MFTRGLSTDFDNDFDLCLRQMFKKDATTKIKSLHKFAQLCDDKDLETVKSILPNWCRVFNKLAFDNDFRIREAVFRAHEHLVRKVGKAIAPFLKQIMATWFLNQQDPYAISSTAARNSFEASFPLEKQQQALIYCREVILSSCLDIITNQSPILLEDQLSSSKEEYQTKHERLIFCSLFGLGKMIETTKYNEAVKEFVAKLLKNDKFWKLEKNQDTSIKVAWYRLKSQICENLPEVIAESSARFTLTTFNHIDESETNLSLAIWDNALWIVLAIPDFWKHIDFSKTFFPKLKSIMRREGGCSAIYPSLLPIIKKIPPEIYEGSFLEELLISFEERMFKEMPYSRDMSVMVKSYFEIIQHILSNANIVDKALKTDELCHKFYKTIKTLLSTKKEAYYRYFSEFINFIENLKNDTFQASCIDLLDRTANDIIESSYNNPNDLNKLLHIMETIMRLKCTKVKRRVKFDPDTIEESSLQKIETHEIFFPFLGRIWIKMQSEENYQNIERLKVLNNTHQKLLSCGIKLDELTNKNFQERIISDIKSRLNAGDEESCSVLLEMFFRIYEVKDDFEILDSLWSFVDYRLIKAIYQQLNKLAGVEKFISTGVLNHFVFDYIKLLIYCENRRPEHGSFLEFLGRFFKANRENNEILENIISFLKNDGLSRNLVDSCTILNVLFENYRAIFLLDIADTLERLFEISLRGKLPGYEEEMARNTWTNGLKTLSVNNHVFVLLAAKLRSLLLNTKLDSERFAMFRANADRLISLYFSQYDEMTDREKFLQTILPNAKELLSLISDNEFPFFTWLCDDLITPLNLKKELQIMDAQFIYPTALIMNACTFVSDKFGISLHNFSEQIPFLYFAWAVLNYAPKDWELEEKTLLPEFETFFEFRLRGTEPELRKQIFTAFKSLMDCNKCFLLLGMKQFLDFNESNFTIDMDLKSLDFPVVSRFQLLHNHIEENSIQVVFSGAILHLLSCEDFTSFNFCAYLAIISTVLKCKRVSIDYHEQIEPLLNFLAGLKSTQNELFLFRKFKGPCRDKKLTLLIAFMNFFNAVFVDHFESFSDDIVDLILISLTSWVSDISLSFFNPENPYLYIFMSRVLNFFLSVDGSIRKNAEKLQNRKLYREWVEFYSVKISKSLLLLLFRLREEDFANYQLVIPSSLRECIKTFWNINMSNFELVPKPRCDQLSKVPETDAIVYPLKDDECSVLMSLNKVIISNNPAFYLTANSITRRLIYLFFHCNEISLDTRDGLLAPPHPLYVMLEETDSIVDAMLADYELGDTCIIKPGTDSFKYSIAYLLNWLSILEFFQQLSSYNKNLLSNFLYPTYFKRLMDNLFRLIPVRSNPQSREDACMIKEIVISGVSELESVTSKYEVDEISVLCYIVYFDVLKKLPAFARLWLNNQNKNLATTFSDFTMTNMSELIIIEELRAVQSFDASQFGDLVVKARNSAREVLVTYTIEEKTIELIIKLPDNHPLGTLSIDVVKCFMESTVRSWQAQLKLFLSYQNSSIVDGLLLLKRNISKRFDPLEECVICLHKLLGPNCKAPELSCRTCRKKFHSTCLHTWFKKKADSTCPLCRSAM